MRLTSSHPTPLARLVSGLFEAPFGGLVLASVAVAALASPASAAQQSPAPVTVLVVVDQLRADLLDRYDEAFSGGFRRLRDEGFHFTRATHDHAITLTAPGHATLSTGTHPSRHGVVSNIWIEADAGGRRVVENVVDEDREAVGGSGRPGVTLDPLERTTVAEWLQDAHPEARILSVSGKARASVLMAGGADGAVLWYDGGVGRFVTDRIWADELPRWAERFNARDLERLQAERVWDLSVPEAHRDLARTDAVDFENDGVDTAFPHAFEAVREVWREPVDWWATTPALDRATRLLAQAGIAGGEIGSDEIPDLVMVSFSQTDVIGHAFGPRSLEQLDNLYRLDAELGEFMSWLDERFGAAGWRMVLTSDHGAADAPEQAASEGRPGKRVSMREAVEFEGELSALAGLASNPSDFQAALIRAAEGLEWIEQAWSFDELLLPEAAVSADSFTVLQARSTFAGRRTGVLGGQGIELRLSEGSLLWTVSRGTTHGSPYLYDRHVPFIALGAGIPPGEHDGAVATTDVAPTLARLLGIATPDDLDGTARPIG